MTTTPYTRLYRVLKHGSLRHTALEGHIVRIVARPYTTGSLQDIVHIVSVFPGAPSSSTAKVYACSATRLEPLEQVNK